MNFINTLKLAWRSVNRSKLRSFLTALGIIIGVGAVIAMLGVGQGARDAVQNQIASLGTNLLIIYPGAAALGGVRMEAGTAQQLTEDDSDAIRKQAPSIEYISPVVRTTEQVVAERQNWRTSIYGGYPEYLAIRDWQIQSGAAFTESDQRGATKVCVIGQTVSTNLFGEGVDPVGQTIRIRNLPFRVTGLLQAKGQTGVGQDQDDIIIAPQIGRASCRERV